MGRIAASSIDQFLGGDGNIEQSLVPDEEENPYLGREEDFAKRKRAHTEKIDVEKRIPGFPLVECGLAENDAVSEAERCLRCQLRLCLAQPPMPPKKTKK